MTRLDKDRTKVLMASVVRNVARLLIHHRPRQTTGTGQLIMDSVGIHMTYVADEQAITRNIGYVVAA